MKPMTDMERAEIVHSMHECDRLDYAGFAKFYSQKLHEDDFLRARNRRVEENK